MTSATKREAPATALPDLISELDALNESLESNEEGVMNPRERERVKAKRNALAEQIADLEDHRSEAARRARGECVVKYRTTTGVRDRLREMSVDEGTSVSDFLDMLVEGEWETRQERLRIAEHKQKKPRAV